MSDAITDLQKTVQRLADLEAIRELAHRYAHCVWQHDVPGAIALFTEDGVMETGDRPPIVGRNDLLETYARMLEGAALQPFVHGHLIELDGDAARGTCYLDLRAVVDGRSMIGTGVYDDEYTRIGAGWRFRRRRLTMRYLVPLEEGWAGAGAGRLPPDPSGG